MASPNACGNIAVLLSALQKEGITYTPSSVKRIVENTCTSLPFSPLMVGCGMINVAAALKSFQAHSEHVEQFQMPLQLSRQGIIVANPSDFLLSNYLAHIRVFPDYPES